MDQEQDFILENKNGQGEKERYEGGGKTPRGLQVRVLPTGCVADGVRHAADVKDACGRLRLRCSSGELETQVGKAGARIRN